MFSDSFIKFRNYLEEGKTVMIKVQGKARFNGEVEPDIMEIHLLSETGQKLLCSLTLRLPLESATSGLAGEILSIAQTHPGTLPLKIEVQNPEDNTWLPLNSAKLKLLANSVLYNKLQKLEGVEMLPGRRD